MQLKREVCLPAGLTGTAQSVAPALRRSLRLDDNSRQRHPDEFGRPVEKIAAVEEDHALSS
ncbi:hypothetical protein GCM10017608_18980 [Agromyces luteolus]|nr:hypothetical protein GCM10017608_18980 [Agromyces luteolus]